MEIEPTVYAGGFEVLAPAPDETIATAIRLHVLAVYGRHGRNKAATAAALGVCEKTLYNALNRMVREGRVTRGQVGLR